MQNTDLIIIFIPSRTVQDDLLPGVLPDFGASPEKKCAGISEAGISFYTPAVKPNILLISDAKVNSRIQSVIIGTTQDVTRVFVAFHASSIHLPNQKAAVKRLLSEKETIEKQYHRSENDLFYVAFEKIIRFFVPRSFKTDDFSQGIDNLIDMFEFNPIWEIQMKLAHSLLVPPSKVNFPEVQKLWDQFVALIRDQEEEDRYMAVWEEFKAFNPSSFQKTPLSKKYVGNENNGYTKLSRKIIN